MSIQEKKVIIITTPPSDIANKIHVSDADFISLIDEDNQNIIFKFITTSSEDKEGFSYYVVKEGFCFCTNSSHFEIFQEFYDNVKLATEKGFSYLEFYFHSQDLEIENEKDYTGFLMSDFYSEIYKYNNTDGIEINKTRFTEFIEAQSKNFINREDYLNAI